ncbi:MAG TPA: DUF4905 domain-containing protein [Bacteroidota bacterium]|nr:DUF4905 domain-containing protein [Bacteroidota bacterium]
MDISSLFQQRHLKPLWSYSTAGVLWRLLFSETNFIVGEERDTDAKQASFFCLNAANGDVLWKSASFGEPWWIGIEGIVHDKVFLHGFRKPDMPEHGKIIAVDLGTGKELWRNNDFAFYSASPGRVFAYRDFFEKRLFYELDAATGEFIQEFSEPPVELPETKNRYRGRENFLFPEFLTEDTPEFPIVAPLVERFCGRSAIHGPVEYVRTGGKLVFNYHATLSHDEEKNVDLLENKLCIVDEANGKQVYADVVNSSTPGAVPDSFFVDDTMMYYIKEKKTLVAVPLVNR